MAEFGENGVEHDTAERIVLDAQHPQRRPAQKPRLIALDMMAIGPLVLSRPTVSVNTVAAAAALRDGDVAAHGARQVA
jgi:hypothetical protein